MFDGLMSDVCRPDIGYGVLVQKVKVCSVPKKMRYDLGYGLKWQAGHQPLHKTRKFQSSVTMPYTLGTRRLKNSLTSMAEGEYNYLRHQ